MRQLYMSARVCNELTPGSLHPQTVADHHRSFVVLRTSLVGSAQIETAHLAEGTLVTRDPIPAQAADLVRSGVGSRVRGDEEGDGAVYTRGQVSILNNG